jgi:hypothetical protein
MMIVFSCRMKTSLLKNLSTLTQVINNAQDTKTMSVEREDGRLAEGERES